MIMQITAPQAQKRCCFKAISSLWKNKFQIFAYLGIIPATRPPVSPKRPRFCRFRHFSILAGRHPVVLAEGGGKLAGAAVAHRLGHPQHTEAGGAQQLSCPLHPPLPQPGVDRQAVQTAAESLGPAGLTSLPELINSSSTICLLQFGLFTMAENSDCSPLGPASALLLGNIPPKLPAGHGPPEWSLVAAR